MDCKKVRDRFSSLLEKELTPAEEKEMQEHLASCPGCQREMKQFEKTMQWLHSVEEEEVPDGFLQEFRKKLEEKKRKVPAKTEGGGFRLPLSFKLPVQAVAMVGILFLVLYVTRMTSLETVPLKEHIPSPSSPVFEEGSKEAQVKEKNDAERQPSYPATVEMRKKEISAREEAKALKPAAPAPEEEAMRDKQMGFAVAKRSAETTFEPEARKKGASAPAAVSMSSQDIVLKVLDREGTAERVNTLIRQFGGEMVRAETNAFLVSLPTASIPEFKKELEQMDALSKKDKSSLPPSDSGETKTMTRVEQEKFETDQYAAVPAPAQKDHTLIHILLIKE